MTFSLSPSKRVSRDRLGRITHIEHIAEPFLSASLGEPSPEQLADDYVAAVSQTYQFESGMVAHLSTPAPEKSTSAGSHLHRGKVKDIAGTIVVDYNQSYRGLPVWGADFAVHIVQSPMRVISSNSTAHTEIILGNDPKEVASGFKRKLTAQAVSDLLGTEPDQGVSRINGMRVMIYEYDPAQRIEPGLDEPEKRDSFEQGPPMPKLPPVPGKFEAGTHYAVVEVLFDLALPDWEGLHWRALIEPVSGAVLYLRPLVSFVTGSIFRVDPISLSGDNTLTPSAPEASLAPWRTNNVELTELIVANPQNLSGTRVELQEIEAPTQAAPTTPPPFDFAYNVKTENFAAVNAYYHVNWIFNLIQGMGFNLENYFDSTIFPVPVDHWALGDVNAHCEGNATGNGIGHFCFGVEQLGQTVGIADDLRVVIHEFCHGMLWDHVNSPNFGFAHSAGDALSAILMDPISHAPDRFLTFPWPVKYGVPLDRRHDRQVSAGWGWFGDQYNVRYGGEQVLSTTLFRLYRSVGGDSPYPSDRAWASRYVAYLIIKAIGTLTVTTNDPRVFADALIEADKTTNSFEGHPGGALHKVIRWAFEKQGLYQPNAQPGANTPVTNEGNPEDVDVYIDDGRNGEYGYRYSFWESKDMWVRLSPDGGPTHQTPVVGRLNYMYVRVKNRGTQTANDVMVKAYHCDPGTGMAWPEHFSPMDTPILPAPGPVPSGGSAVVGPFPWTPERDNHECLLAIASANGDDGNDTTVLSSIPHSRFVPFDNNIGQRNVVPVMAIDELPHYHFCVINPFRHPATVELVPILPKHLRDQNYWVFFTKSGANRFALAPFESKRIGFRLSRDPRILGRFPWRSVLVVARPGISIPEEVIDREQPRFPRVLPIKLQIVALIDGQLMGGMTYVLGKGKEILGTGLAEEPGLVEEVGEAPDIKQLCDSISQQPGVKSARVKAVTLEIEFKD